MSGRPQVSLDRGHQPAVRHQQAAPRLHHGIARRAASGGHRIARRAGSSHHGIARRAASHYGIVCHAASLPFACVREHMYYVCAHAHYLPGEEPP